jgi:uncharacterized protein (DUF433 family)
MSTVAQTQAVPIRVDLTGTWRVGDSRVTVEVVIGQFLRGSTPEQIQDDFSTLGLAEIYGVISYYLTHQREVESYMEERKAQAAEIRRKWEARSDVQELRQKLRRARDERAQSGN